MVSDISAFLVVRVVMFVTNSSKTAFSFVANTARLSKYLLRAVRTIDVLLPLGSLLMDTYASNGVTLYAAPIFYFPLAAFSFIASFFAAK